jgi:Fur family ferric uptake transcriptional regulator
MAALKTVTDRPHCTADQVTDGVRAEIGSISRQAVYDALGLFTGKGLLRRIHVAGAAALCERHFGDSHHRPSFPDAARIRPGTPPWRTPGSASRCCGR